MSDLTGPSENAAPIVVLVGPESTGKTTLAERLASAHDAALVREYAREYLDAARLHGRETYSEQDLEAIARQQWALERRARDSGPGSALIVADTDLIVIAIWWDEVFGGIPGWIREVTARRDLGKRFLLCRPDLAWQPDPLRESPHDLDRLFNRYQAMLDELSAPYAIVEGVGETRFENAQRAVQSWLTDGWGSTGG